jgi:hypothetical protein
MVSQKPLQHRSNAHMDKEEKVTETQEAHVRKGHRLDRVGMLRQRRG